MDEEVAIFSKITHDNIVYEPKIDDDGLLIPVMISYSKGMSVDYKVYYQRISNECLSDIIEKLLPDILKKINK